MTSMATITSAPVLKEKLIKGLGATYVEVKDTSGGCGQSFEAVIVSAQFEGKRLLDRHRLVHQCLAKELESIHAFAQKTYTPEQWDKMS